MKKLITFFFVIAPTISVASLPYPCREALRRQVGKVATYQQKMQQIKESGDQNQKKFLLQQMNSTVNALKNGRCPENDPEVSKVIAPTSKMISELGGMTKTTTPKSNINNNASSTMSNKTNGNAKIPYSCRQVLQRQKSKPSKFENDLQYYRNLVQNPKANFMLYPGLDITNKVDAVLADLTKGNCPSANPEIEQLITKLNTQKDEANKLYNQLVEIKNGNKQKGNTSNYPEYEKDIAKLESFFDRYRNPSHIFWQIKDRWIENKVSSVQNVQTPIQDYESAKEILSHYEMDESAIIAMKQKYKDLFANNPTVANRYVTLTKPALRGINELKNDYIPYFLENYPKALDINFRVIDTEVKRAIKDKKPAIIENGILKPMEVNQKLISFLKLIKGKGEQISSQYQAKYNTKKEELAQASQVLAQTMLENKRMPQEKYIGNSKSELIQNITAQFKKQYPNKEILKVHITTPDFKRKTYWQWNNVSWQLIDYSFLNFVAVVKHNDSIAFTAGGAVRIKHRENDKREYGFLIPTEKEAIMFNDRILISNI